LLSSPITRNAAQTRRSRCNAMPNARRTTSRISAAPATRAATTVKGGNSATANWLKKNDPPQTTDSRIRRPHSTAFIGRWITGTGMTRTLLFGPLP